MLRFVTLFGALALAVAAPQHNIVLLDNLPPDVAAGYINSPPFTAPQLSVRSNVLPLVRYNDPRFRAAEAGPTLGHYWKNGKEIENTDDYVEEVYNAAQYHGQDGLGAYAYGYQTPESSKTESKQRSGDVNGAYTYKAGSSNNLIQVRYWADSQGFHQEDNLPKYVPKPVEEAPEVRDARIAHEKAWNEAAYANLHPGDAARNAAAVAPTLQNNYPNYAYAASQQQSSYFLPPNQPRKARAVGQYDNQYNPQSQYQNLNQYQNQYQGQEYYTTTTTTTTPAPEPTGPPHGFFYSFTYPVSIITPKKLLNEGNPSYQQLDSDTVALGQQKK